MPSYCLDTSGISNPLENLPEDIYASLWGQVSAVMRSGKLCWNKEILDELSSIEGAVGECIKSCADAMCYEVGNDGWPWQDYLNCVERMRTVYRDVISEYNGNRKSTVGLNDISIIALAKTLKLPLVNMERPNTHQPSVKRMRIPDVCIAEGITPMNFNDFLRAEAITLEQADRSRASHPARYCLLFHTPC
jgi:Domain of unknown function (DUF4411)